VATGGLPGVLDTPVFTAKRRPSREGKATGGISPRARYPTRTSSSRVADIEECPQGLRVRIRRSKTDQEGGGAVVAVWRGSIACPVAAVRDWLAVGGIIEGPVFRRVNKCGQLGREASH
jgi:hypothetical protein